MDKIWNYKNFNMVNELDIAGEFVYDGIQTLNQMDVISDGAAIFSFLYHVAVGIERLQKILIVLFEDITFDNYEKFEKSIKIHRHNKLHERISNTQKITFDSRENDFLDLLTTFYKESRYNRFNLNSPYCQEKEIMEKYITKYLDENDITQRLLTYRDSDSKMVDTTLAEYINNNDTRIAKLKVEVLVCTIEREEEAFIPKGDFVFEEKDIVSIMASPKQANEFFDKIEYKGNSIKNAVIVGGGSITHYLCSILERSKISLKIIEKDLEVCEQLSNEWEKITVVHGDGLNKELLLEEGIENTDAFVSLLNHDEDNILLSLFLRRPQMENISIALQATTNINVYLFSHKQVQLIAIYYCL